jgi:hypothetical protein
MSLARACKWSDFLGHTNPIYARADLLITKVHGLEILFCGTGVVYAPGEVEQFAARHPSIPQANGTYLTDMITVRQELLPYHKWLLRGQYQSRAFALPCNRSKCTRGHDEQCIFLHRLQVPCLPAREFGGKFAGVVRDFGRFFVCFPPPPPGDPSLTNGVFSESPLPLV